jgi:hypothetical protein
VLSGQSLWGNQLRQQTTDNRQQTTDNRQPLWGNQLGHDGSVLGELPGCHGLSDVLMSESICKRTAVVKLVRVSRYVGMVPDNRLSHSEIDFNRVSWLI